MVTIAISYLVLIFLLISPDIESKGDNYPEKESHSKAINVHQVTLNNGMIIDLFLPEGYSSNKKYPLLLINDGEQIFQENGWNLEKILRDLIDKNKISPIIVAAVHSNGNRNNWYIPYKDNWITKNWGNYSPQSEYYANELIQKVIPELTKRYSVEQNEIGILGASLGGLVSTWLGLNYPEIIKYSASLSGSFWVADYKIVTDINSEYPPDNKFWFDIGTGEWNYYVPFYKALNDSGLVAGKQSFYYEVPDGQHTISDWSNRIENPLKLFFGTHENTKVVSMNVIPECISSQSTPGKKFRRLNPVLKLSNEVRYSLAHNATYILINGSAEIGKEGSFFNDPDTEVKIRVNYQQFSEDITIPKGWCH